MPRPKGSKNKPKIPVIKEVEETTPAEVVKPPQEDSAIKRRKKEKEPECYCAACGSPVFVTPIKVNLTWLTGMASYHREVSADRFDLCCQCAKEFNDYCDKWFLKRGVGEKFAMVD